MAKHYSKRASRNRASKKRRANRKLRKTIRRRLHMVGGGEIEVMIIKYFIQLIPTVIPIIIKIIDLGNVELLMSIIKLLSGRGGGGGSNKRQKQRGGGLKDQVLSKLNGLKTKFAGNVPVLSCIDTISARITESNYSTDTTSEIQSLEQDLLKQDQLSTDTPVNNELPVEQPKIEEAEKPQIEEAAKLKMHEKIINFFNERIKNKITANIDTKIQNIRSKVGEDVIACLQTLKTAIVNDIIEQLRQRKDIIKDEVIKTLNHVGGEIFTRLMFIAVQLSFGNRMAVFNMLKDDLGKFGVRASEFASNAKDRFSNNIAAFSGHLDAWINRDKTPPNVGGPALSTDSVTTESIQSPEQKQGLFQGFTSGFAGFKR